MSDDREEVVRQVGRALEASAEKLIARGVSEEEVGKAMTATGLAIWSRAVGLPHVTGQLAGMTLGMADAAGLDLDAQKTDRPN